MIISRVLVAAATMAVSITAVSSNGRTPNQESVQSSISSQANEPEKQRAAKNKLASLLAKMGVQVSTDSQALETQTHRQLQIHWETSTPLESEISAAAAQSPSGILTVKHSTVAIGGLPRLRSLEFSPTQVLVIAVDGKANLLWWHLQTDPRLLRAETVSASGEVTGRISYLRQIDFSIAYPDLPTIRELRFYKPEWTGEEFRLRALGVLGVP